MLKLFKRVKSKIDECVLIEIELKRKRLNRLFVKIILLGIENQDGEDLNEIYIHTGNLAKELKVRAKTIKRDLNFLISNKVITKRQAVYMDEEKREIGNSLFIKLCNEEFEEKLKEAQVKRIIKRVFPNVMQANC